MRRDWEALLNEFSYSYSCLDAPTKLRAASVGDRSSVTDSARNSGRLRPRLTKELKPLN